MYSAGGPLGGQQGYESKKPWVGNYYHATYSCYARGVSILVHKSLTFKFIDVKTDSGGRYVLLHAIVDTLELLIVGIYIPLPATISLLKGLVPIIATYATDNIIIVGDFNMLPSPALDKLASGIVADSPLSKWASLYGLTDVWRWKHPTDRAFTCQSASYCTLSRIDLIYASGGILPKVTKTKIPPRDISHHAPMLCCLQTSTPHSERVWRLSRFWISDPTIGFKITNLISEYWRLNAHTATSEASWDAFKVYFRGCYQS